jgi:Fe-S cluster biogenesis protein NfuA
MQMANSENSDSGAMSQGTNVTVRPEQTPNPQTLRFVVSYQPAARELTSQPAEFKSAKETMASPLAKKLFGFPWTAGVYIGRDFIAVSKQDWVDWETLASPLADLIQEHLERGEPIILEPQTKSDSAGGTPSDDSDEVRTIKLVLDREIRPMVAQDGGDVVFHKFENGTVYLFMQGACSGCPSSTMTLKMGIEGRLKEAVPSIIEVVAMS